MIEALTDTSDLDAERGELQNEADVVTELIKKAISENAHKAQDQEEYQRKYEGYCARFEKARNRLAEIEDICLERNAKKVKIQMFMERMGQYDGLVTEFDEELWYSTVDMVTVSEDKRMVFTFHDGNTSNHKKRGMAGGIINGPQVLFQSLRAFRRLHGIDKGEQGFFLLVV